MIKYIIQDVWKALRYLPYGLMAGVMVLVLFNVLNDKRIEKNKKSFSVPAVTGLFVYGVIILCITLLSRESGSRSEVVDLKLFSTWGINARNNAYVVENILLFIPYGILLAGTVPMAKGLAGCTLLGMGSSFSVELLQVFTGRGYFQLDDILTNMLGTAVGYLVRRLVCGKRIRR